MLRSPGSKSPSEARIFKIKPIISGLRFIAQVVDDGEVDGDDDDDDGLVDEAEVATADVANEGGVVSCKLGCTISHPSEPPLVIWNCRYFSQSETGTTSPSLFQPSTPTIDQ